MKGWNASSAPANPVGPGGPSPAAASPHPAPACAQSASLPSPPNRLSSARPPAPPPTRARSPSGPDAADCTAPESHTSAANRSPNGYPTSRRTSGPEPTPERPFSCRSIGPAAISTQGCGVAAAITSASISIDSASRREDERIGHEHLAAALGNGEAPGLDLRRHAGLHARIPQRALLRVRLGDRAALVDGPRGHQLAGEARLVGELRLVAGADLRAVVVDHLADQLRIDRPGHFRLARPEADVAVLLAAQPALAVAVVGEAAADSIGADAGEAEARAVASAAAAAQRLETHAAVAAGIGHARAGQVAHRVAGALLQRDS